MGCPKGFSRKLIRRTIETAELARRLGVKIGKFEYDLWSTREHGHFRAFIRGKDEDGEPCWFAEEFLPSKPWRSYPNPRDLKRILAIAEKKEFITYYWRNGYDR